MATYTIYVTRLWETEQSTISRFSISGSTLQGYILERPGPDTMEGGLRQRIPEGVYDLSWHPSKKATGYNQLPQLSNGFVSKNRWILIHPGNGPEDTDGCLLPARRKDHQPDKVNSSRPIFGELYSLISQKGIDNFKVKITSCYENSCKLHAEK